VRASATGLQHQPRPPYHGFTHLALEHVGVLLLDVHLLQEREGQCCKGPEICPYADLSLSSLCFLPSDAILTRLMHQPFAIH
jgi:hypothetical protein